MIQDKDIKPMRPMTDTQLKKTVEKTKAIISKAPTQINLDAKHDWQDDAMHIDKQDRHNRWD